MNVGVVGAGALGTLFGASLAREASVRMLVRSQAAAHALQSRGGLCIEGEAPRPVVATSDPNAMLDLDVLLIAVKAFDTAAALRPLRGILGPATPLVSLQNGLEARAQIEAALGERPAIALAPTTEAGLSLDAGFVRRTGRGITMLGWAQARDGGAWLETFATMLGRAGLAVTVVRPVEPHVWAKAIVNAAVNPLTALASVPNGALLERSEQSERLFAIAREGAEVAKAAGIVLPFHDVEAYVAAVVRATAANRSSMLRDLERGRPTEIEEIDGAIVRVAHRFGVAVPETERVLHEVRARGKA